MKDFEYGTFEPSFLDSNYRRFASEALSNSSAVEVIGDNLSCINYPEILYQIKQGTEAGVHVMIYFKKAPEWVLNFLKELDLSLYMVEAPFAENEHIVFEGRKVLATKVSDGRRVGDWKIDENFAKNVLSSVESIRGKTIKVGEEKETCPKRGHRVGSPVR